MSGQFPKMAAHLSGRGIGNNCGKNIWFGDQTRDKGRQWCSLNVTPRSENRKGALGETAVNALGGSPAQKLQEPPRAQGQGGTSVHRQQGNQEQ